MPNHKKDYKGKLIAKDKNIRLDLFLYHYFSSFSRTKIKKYILNGNVLVNNKVSLPSLVLKGGEQINYDFIVLDESSHILPEKMDLEILYEDQYIVAINKPAGLVVHPGNGVSSGTLANGLVFHFDKLSKINKNSPGIVHRLDKETSGVILVAKNDEIHVNLSKQFESRLVQKVYRAIVWGNIKSSGLIKGFIGRNQKNRTTFSLQKKGRDSESSFKKIDYFEPLSYVEIYPKTGRTHQIRVHLTSISHPILCDENYGGGLGKIKSYHMKYKNLLNLLFKSINRVALHAYAIEIAHPANNRKMKIFAPIPDDFNYILNILKEQ
tara:strand:- start:798 stop:1766 length:969 start_codon:yes stop_codon:yes gene_type:complete